MNRAGEEKLREEYQRLVERKRERAGIVRQLSLYLSSQI